jgi:hypothetical protein
VNRLADGVRLIAIAIAIAGVIDPVIRTERPGRPVVSVVAGPTTADRALGDRVARALANDALVTREGSPASDATVLAGDALAPAALAAGGPLFAVTAGADAVATITALEAPATAALGSRVAVRVRGSGAGGGRRLYVLHVGGSAVDSVSRSGASGEAVALTFVPTAAGPARIAVTMTTGAATVRAEGLVEVRAVRWPVLVYDARPAWTSTFVRRALEQDARFVVASRVVTSRAIAREAGRVPSQFDDPALLASFDAIVVGAPDALTERDVSALERYARDRGGRIVLLLDAVAAGPWQRLAGGAPWRVDSTGASALVRSRFGAADSVHAREIGWPTDPATATVLATATRARDSVARPVIVRRALGAGTVVSSGVLDSWRARDRDGADADRFWLALIAGEAAQRVPPLSAIITPNVIGRGERAHVQVTLRDGAPGRAITAAARIVSDADTAAHPVRLWPELTPGAFSGGFTLPAAPGSRWLEVTSEGTTIRVPFVSDTAAPRAASADGALLRALSVARGGAPFAGADLARLGPAVVAAVRPPLEPSPRTPMRAPWWIIPFALALCGEWWLRRRAGRP